jgi:threonine dehydrogenase-like Zn-dependent dehydrogenase
VRFEERDIPKIINPTDAIVRISAACVCGSHLWPYRGIQPVTQPMSMGHEDSGIVEELGSEVKSVRPGQYFTILQTLPTVLRVASCWLGDRAAFTMLSYLP